MFCRLVRASETPFRPARSFAARRSSSMSSSAIPRLDCADGQPLDSEKEAGRIPVRALLRASDYLIVCLAHNLLLRLPAACPNWLPEGRWCDIHDSRALGDI